MQKGTFINFCVYWMEDLMCKIATLQDVCLLSWLPNSLDHLSHIWALHWLYASGWRLWQRLSFHSHGWGHQKIFGNSCLWNAIQLNLIITNDACCILGLLLLEHSLPQFLHVCLLWSNHLSIIQTWRRERR